MCGDLKQNKNINGVNKANSQKKIRLGYCK